jgi:hypothetical protein
MTQLYYCEKLEMYRVLFSPPEELNEPIDVMCPPIISETFILLV